MLAQDKVINYNGFPFRNVQVSRNNNHFKNNLNINYNNDYCLYGGIDEYEPVVWNSNYRSTIHNMIKELSDKVQFNSIVDIMTNHIHSEVINHNITNFQTILESSDLKHDFRTYMNNFLKPSNKVICGYEYGKTLDTIQNFTNPAFKLIITRSHRIISGGGLYAVADRNIIKPLFALVIRKEYVQLPRLSYLLNMPIEKNDDLFQIYVQGGFDYKDTEYKSLRSMYRKEVLPWAAKHNIPVVIRPNLMEDLFLVPKIPTFATARETTQYKKELYDKAHESIVLKIATMQQQIELIPW